MKIGFTGTSSGMSEAQRAQVLAWLKELGGTQLHHGDCIGADADAHTIARSLGLEVIVHPPTNDESRAFCRGAAAEREPKDYLKRNKAIVDETDVLVATPYGPEQRRSGTWSTIRYARKRGRVCYVVMRDGTVASRV